MTDHNDFGDDPAMNERATDHARLMLRDAMPAATFSSGFADRTMARLVASRIAASPAVQRFTAMQHSFRLLAAAAAIAIVALGVHNTMVARVADTTLVEAAIGLQPVSAESVLSYTSEALQ
jgi:hypothetical protein